MDCSPPAPPSDVSQNRGIRCTPGGGCAPCTLLGGQGRQCFLTWRVGTLSNQGKRDRDPRPNLPPSTRAGTEAPPGGGRGDGTVAKRDPARSRRGHSPVKRGHSAVIAPTAVRPRCDGLFPACAEPSDVSQNRGTRCTPGGGCAPCTLLGGMAAASFAHLARRDAF